MKNSQNNNIDSISKKTNGVRDEVKKDKNYILNLIDKNLQKLSETEIKQKQKKIEDQLFNFANFRESLTAFLYTPISKEIPTHKIIKTALQVEKQIVLPVFSNKKKRISLFKITNLDKDLITNADGILEPNIETCKKISINDIDIAVIPGLAFDDKGGRIGLGLNFYNNLILKLPETCRKIAIAFEEHIVNHITMESRKFAIDIVITDKRIIYKI